MAETRSWDELFLDPPCASLPEAVARAIGAGSMCWTPRPSSEVFDSERASGIVDSLVRWIAVWLLERGLTPDEIAADRNPQRITRSEVESRG